MSAATIHVEPRRGSWVVREETGQNPVSEHGDATAATRAARERARRFAAEATVLLHDRYGRVRRVTVGARHKS